MCQQIIPCILAGLGDYKTMNTWGHAVTLSIFGESHGPEIGIVIGGLPPGLRLDMAAVNHDMARRAPGQGAHATARSEADAVHIVSGVKDGVTTGAPLTGIIANTNARSSDYSPMLRPGHADWAALVKYAGYADMSGGGHFSGRLTAPLVFAGAIAKHALAAAYGTKVWGRIIAIGGENTTPGEANSGGTEVEQKFLDIIAAAKKDSDSVGGVIEIIAESVPAGLGEPFFGSVESRLSALYFSVPAVKSVEFGGGSALAALRGSAANDAIRVCGGDAAGMYSETNTAGGILGGITNGMPLVARVAFKPTPSIASVQKSVDPVTFVNTDLVIKGRHDPCIVPRAVPVVEACTALALLDLACEAARYAPWHNTGASQ
jgi:chorismate synthase